MSANRVRVLLAAALLAALAIVLVACGQAGPGEDSGRLVDTGPNAGLRNDELVSQAIVNMQALTSYHSEMVERPLPESALGSPVFTATGDLQGLTTGGRGSRFWLEYVVVGVPRSDYEAYILAQLGPLTEMIVTGGSTGNKPYYSTDGEITESAKAWRAKAWYEGYIALDQLNTYMAVWGAPADSSSPGKPKFLRVLREAKWADGSPRIEKVGGVTTRHMVMTTQEGKELPEPRAARSTWRERTRSLHLWVSTDDVPLVRQMRAEIGGGEPGYASDIQRLTRDELYATFGPSGSRLAINNIRGSFGALLWDTSMPGSEPTLVAVPRSATCAGRATTTIRLSPDDNVFALVVDRCTAMPGEDRLLYLFDLRKQSTPYRTWQMPPRSWLVFSPDAKMLVGTAKDGIYTWDPEKQEAPHLAWKLPSISDVEFSPDGKMLAAGGSEGIYIWEPTLPDGAALPLTIPESAGVADVTFSADNHTLVAALKTSNPVWDTLVEYDLTNPEGSRKVLGTVRQVWWIPNPVSPDGRWLAISTGDGTTLTDLREQREVLRLPGNLPVIFSPDSKYMVTNDYDAFQLWHLDNLAPRRAPGPPIELMSNISQSTAAAGKETKARVLLADMAFSADSKRLTVAGPDGFVRQWNLADLADPAKAAAARPTTLVSPPDPQGFYAITWKWSRFNEDFGEVQAPPADTVREP